MVKKCKRCGQIDCGLKEGAKCDGCRTWYCTDCFCNCVWKWRLEEECINCTCNWRMKLIKKKELMEFVAEKYDIHWDQVRKEYKEKVCQLYCCRKCGSECEDIFDDHNFAFCCRCWEQGVRPSDGDGSGFYSVLEGRKYYLSDRRHHFIKCGKCETNSF